MADKNESKKEKQPASNLKRGPGNPAWRKGVSGNPNGRKPKTVCLLSCIKDELAKLSENKLLTNEQMIAQALIFRAKVGDLKAIEIIMAYTVPKPKESVDLTTNGESLNRPIIEVVSAEARKLTEAIISGKGTEQCVN